MKLATRALGHTVPRPPQRRALYDDLTIELPPGKLTAVIGPNGAGKSTLLRQLLGIDAPERGEVTLDGTSLAKVPRRTLARNLAYLPQSTPLYYDLRVRDVVMLGRGPYLGRFSDPSAGDEAAVQDALRQVEVEELAERGVLSLSGGERQRVMLARMLATRAPILILDEPTTALDIGHTLAFLELCRRLSDGGSTVIIAMHELELARRYADVALCLTGHGQTVFGPAIEVMSAGVLEPIFRVSVRRGEHGIAFFPEGE